MTVDDQWKAFILQVIPTLGVPVLLWLAWLGVDALKQRGYQTAYADALLRAVGAGASAARQQGETVFTPRGRAVALNAGVDYLMQTVPTAAKELGIDTPEAHQTRLNAQIGTLIAQADITNEAMAAAVAIPEAPVQAVENR